MRGWAWSSGPTPARSATADLAKRAEGFTQASPRIGSTVPPQFNLRFVAGPRDPELLPVDDEALGDALMGRVTQALIQGVPRPALLLLRDEQVDQVDIVDVLQAPAPDRERMLAALASQPGVRCCALAGAMTLQRRRGPEIIGRQRAVVVFLEWPDNRWWSAWLPVADDRRPLADAPVIQRAVDGSPRPNGVGGWFSLARRENLRLNLHRPESQRGLDLVH